MLRYRDISGNYPLAQQTRSSDQTKIIKKLISYLKIDFANVAYPISHPQTQITEPLKNCAYYYKYSYLLYSLIKLKCML